MARNDLIMLELESLAEELHSYYRELGLDIQRNREPRYRNEETDSHHATQTTGHNVEVCPCCGAKIPKPPRLYPRTGQDPKMRDSSPQ